MSAARFSHQFGSMLRMAMAMAGELDADGLLVLLEEPTDWAQLKKAVQKHKVVLAADHPSALEGAKEVGFDTVNVNLPGAPVYEQLTQALLEAVADDLLEAGADVIAVYSGFEAGEIDSLGFVRLDERLGRLTARDLRKLETQVPLETLKLVVDLAVDIGREGREGKPVGTMFVVGDHRAVLEHCRPLGFDPVRGYKRSERNLHDSHVREAVKECAQMDGAFVIEVDATLAAACQYIGVGSVAVMTTLSKGLGTRHAAAAAISKKTNAIAIAVSESSGTVRLFLNGEVVLRIEPFRRAMTVKEYDGDGPSA